MGSLSRSELLKKILETNWDSIRTDAKYVIKNYDFRSDFSLWFT